MQQQQKSVKIKRPDTTQTGETSLPKILESHGQSQQTNTGQDGPILGQ